MPQIARAQPAVGVEAVLVGVPDVVVDDRHAADLDMADVECGGLQRAADRLGLPDDPQLDADGQADRSGAPRD